MSPIVSRMLATWLVFTLLLSAALADNSAEAKPAKPTTAEQTEPRHELVSLELWAISLRVPEIGTSDDELDHVLASVGDLPTIIGHQDDASALISRLERQKAIVKLQEFRVTTVEGHEAALELGERKPRVTATSITQFGTTNAIVMEPCGVTLEMTPHIAADGSILVNVKFQESELQNTKDAAIYQPKSGATIYMSTPSTYKVAADARLKDGEAAVIAFTPQGHEASESPPRMVILSAAVHR